jgi:predicted DNA-binding transcriptional regulator YafY
MPILRPIPRPKAPRVGRPTGKFTQHRRLDILREKLETHSGGLTLEELAQMLRITTRSVRRYLRELALVTELESIAVRPGSVHLWRIKPSERGRAVPLRRTQAYTLLAARRVFEVLKGSALFDEIDVTLRQIEQVARRPTARAHGRGEMRGEGGGDARLEDRFAYVPPAARAYANRSDDIDEAFRAVAELCVLRFRYQEPRYLDGKEAPREAKERGVRVTAHPYALVLHGGAIACIARDLERAVSRVFAFDRMAELQASEAERFELPPDFAIGDWLHGDFGVAGGARTVKLLVEFEPPAADAVRTRRVHPSQRNQVAADGRVRASMTLPETPEVLERAKIWLLGFGASVRVIEPRALADDVARELRRAAQRYE